jgi:hypothetical protein
MRSAPANNRLIWNGFSMAVLYVREPVLSLTQKVRLTVTRGQRQRLIGQGLGMATVISRKPTRAMFFVKFTVPAIFA